MWRKYSNFFRNGKIRPETEELMRSMRKAGMTYRQIAEALGYKSHTSVLDLIRKNER